MAEKDLISNRRRSSFPSPVVVDTFYQESIDRKSGLVGVLVWLLVHIRVVLLLVTFFFGIAVEAGTDLYLTEVDRNTSPCLLHVLPIFF